MYSKIPQRVLCSIAVACGLWIGSIARAHQIWLEQDNQGATLYFGEFGENLRETSPGLLDKFVQPVAQKIGVQATQPLTVSKTAKGFAIAGRAAQGESLVAQENAYPVSQYKEDNNTVRSIYQPAARLITDFSAQPPSLTLDLVPTGSSSPNGVELQAFYQAQPLPKAKIIVVTAAGEEQEYYTNADGKLVVPLPSRGTYVMELSYTDRRAGQRGGDSYDLANYVTSLTLIQIVSLPPSQTQTAAAEAFKLPEIVVLDKADATSEGTGSYIIKAPVSTATKLGLKVRETPQSISIITRERMEEMGLKNLSETMQATTGVYVSNNDTERVTYSARGYSIGNFQVDGMLNTFGGSLKTNGDNVVYDHIEVVRGATGLTTGAGDPSATINQVRKRPTRNFQGNAAVTIGSYNLRRGEIDLSGPLAFEGKIRGRVVAAQQKTESFRPLYEKDTNAFYAILEADVGPDTVVGMGFEQQKSDPGGATWGTVPYWNADGSVANLPFNLNLSTPWASWNMVEKKSFATVEHRFSPDWRTRASLTHSNRVQDGSLYFGGSGYPRPDGSGITVYSGRFPSDEDMDVLDINVDGKFNAWGRKHDVVLGWGSSKRDSSSARVTYATMPAGYDTIPDWQNWTGNIDEFGSTVQPFPASEGEITQKAGYLATRLHIAEPLKLVLGARYGSYETQTRNYGTTGTLTGTSGFRINGEITPYAGVLYDLNPQWTAYAGYTSIFQPQNYRDKSNAILDPVVGKSIEAGLKAELLDNRLNLALALFRSNKDNVAEIDDSVAPNSLPGGGQAYKSTGKGNVADGVEFEAIGRLTSQWNLSTGYSYTRSRDAKGNAINTVLPRSLLRVFTSYRFAGDWKNLNLGGGFNWQSSFWSAAQQPTGAYNPSGAPITAASRIVQEAVLTLNLMASYQINDQLTARLNVSNLFNRHYYSRVGFYNGVYAAEPRSLSLTLRGTF